MESQDRDGYTIEGIRHLIRFKLSVILLLSICAAAKERKLPPGPGRATVQRVCTACHAADVFAAQAHTKQEWADIVDEMSNAGATASDAEFQQIIAYLTKNFPRKR
jgi:mono/diheme cytochrome c family protein